MMRNESSEARHTGGCQCGAVRYALLADPYDAHICHCRMCQKAFGSFFAPLVKIRRTDFQWTTGSPTRFQSSVIARRGFCRDCGTPLTYEPVDRDYLDVSLGSLDDPARIMPANQYGIESRMPWFDCLHTLPGEPTGDDIERRVDALVAQEAPDR